MPDFSLRHAFQRLDKRSANQVCTEDLIDFMSENKITNINLREMKNLIGFYDNDSNGELNFKELIQMLMPCEDN